MIQPIVYSLNCTDNIIIKKKKKKKKKKKLGMATFFWFI
jgi:hypothetical protein